jgi:hypothetical protein
MIQKQFSFRSITNNGDKSKIIITLLESPNKDYPPTVLIYKRILVKDKNLVKACLKCGLKQLRKFKGYTYLEEKAGYKLSTLFHILQGLILMPNARISTESNKSNKGIQKR